MRNQVRISLSPELHQHVLQKATNLGLSSSESVKNLIIQDMKDAQKSSLDDQSPIETIVIRKKRYSNKDYTLIKS